MNWPSGYGKSELGQWGREECIGPVGKGREGFTGLVVREGRNLHWASGGREGLALRAGLGGQQTRAQSRV